MLYNDKYDGISTQNIGIDSLIRLFNEKEKRKRKKNKCNILRLKILSKWKSL